MDAERRRAIAKKNQNWSYYGVKCLVEIWADEEIQRNIWEKIVAKPNDK